MRLPETLNLNASPSVEAGLSDGEAAWNAALIQAEYARRDYAQCLRASERDESELGRLWLLLWLAEWRRDELFRRLE
jgi:hypothetical protein